MCGMNMAKIQEMEAMNRRTVVWVSAGAASGVAKVISLGMGTQSSAMYLMSSMGVLPRADIAIFADTGAEHPKTIEYAKWLIDWQKKNDGIPIYVASYRDIMSDIMSGKNSTGQRWASIPAFSEGGGMIRRQCTSEYKIRQVIKKLREVYKLKPRARMLPTEMWIGITREEASRMKPSQFFNIENCYPVIENRRGELMSWMSSQGFPLPVKSSCVFCPYQSNKRWRDMRDNFPETFSEAVKVDDRIRDLSKKGVKEKIYLHRSLRPIKEIDFDDNQIDMFGNECEGHCGL